MNKATIKTNVTLIKKDYQKIKHLVTDERYISASEFIRQAIRNELEKIENNEKENNKDNIFLNR